MLCNVVIFRRLHVVERTRQQSMPLVRLTIKKGVALFDISVHVCGYVFIVMVRLLAAFRAAGNSTINPFYFV